ncbi:MAG: hypothetical protein Kow00103_11580 [Candidatus Caldatribacteriota bacterium]
MIFLLFNFFFIAILFFLIITLIFIPYGFTVYSFLTIFTVPQQILRIAQNKSIRQNHALEHATINILERYAGRTLPLSGLAEKNGFIISGVDDAELILEAAREGLYRLKKGECDLVIHKKCGTSMAIANFVAALLFLILIISTGIFSIFTVIIAILVANLLGRYLGELVQKYFTTSCAVGDLEIVGIKPEYSDEFTNQILFNYMPRGYFVQTENYRLLKY